MFITSVPACARPLLIGAIATAFAFFFAVTARIPSTESVASIVLACATVFVMFDLFQGPPRTIGEVLYQAEQEAPTRPASPVELSQ